MRVLIQACIFLSTLLLSTLTFADNCTVKINISPEWEGTNISFWALDMSSNMTFPIGTYSSSTKAQFQCSPSSDYVIHGRYSRGSYGGSFTYVSAKQTPFNNELKVSFPSGFGAPNVPEVLSD